MCALYTQRPWSRKPSTPVLLGPSELARALGLRSPSVVTNWRARSPEFPDDRVGGTQPRFDLVEVVDWLLHHGPRNSSGLKLSPIDWWGYLCEAIALSRSAEAPRHTMAAIVALREALLVRSQLGADGVRRWRALEEPSSADLHALARWVEREDARLRGMFVPWLSNLDERSLNGILDLIDALRRLDDVPGKELLDPVLAGGHDQRPRQQRVTHAGLARLMVALARIAPGDTVLDPASGEGEILVAAHRAVPTARLIGGDIDRESLALARMRAFVEDAELELHGGIDTLRDGWLTKVRAEVVLIDPPVDGAPPVLRWMEFGLEHLAHGGRLVVNVPLHLLAPVRSVRRRPDAETSDFVEMLAESGALRSMVIVHQRVRHDVAGPTALCVVEQHAPTDRQVQVVVVGDGTRGSVLQSLADQVAGREALDGSDQVDGVEVILIERRDFVAQLTSAVLGPSSNRLKSPFLAKAMMRSPARRLDRSVVEVDESVVVPEGVGEAYSASRSWSAGPPSMRSDRTRPPAPPPPPARSEPATPWKPYRELAVEAVQAMLPHDLERARALLAKLEELDRRHGVTPPISE